MSITVDGLSPLLQTADGGEKKAQATNSKSFEDALSASLSSTGGVEKARAAAELLKLEMARSTLALEGGEAQAEPSLVSRTVAGLLASLKEAGYVPPEQVSAAAVPQVRLPAPPPAEEGPSLPAAPGGDWLEALTAAASRRYGVDQGLIKAVIHAESNGNPNAVSHAGAQGLMQLMPSTAQGLGVTDSFDPEQNVMGGTKFLKSLLDRYNGDIDKALAAYNWGPGHVDRGGSRMPAETRAYLARVKGYYARYTG